MKKTLILLSIALVIVSIFLAYTYTDKKTYATEQVYKQAKQMNIDWGIKVEFSSIAVPKETLLGSKAGHEFAAMVTPSPEYYSAVVTFNSPVLKELSKKEIRELVQHELTHIYMTEMREYIFKELKPTDDQKDWIIYHEERMITNLTKAF